MAIGQETMRTSWRNETAVLLRELNKAACIEILRTLALFLVISTEQLNL